MPLIKRSYDKDYHEAMFYREVENSQRNRARLELVREFAPSAHRQRLADRQRLLEIGCGTGGFLRMAEARYEIEGIDISPQAIEAIQPHFSSRVRVANIEVNTIPANHYNIVAAFNILEHLRDPAAAVRAIAAALKPGGLLIGSVPHNDRLIGRAITRIGNFIDRTHVATLPPGTWREIFQQAGFSAPVFFGEIPFGRNRARYLRGASWQHFAFNLMFACYK